MSKPTKNIKAVQKLLKQQGYNPGAIDNVWGPKTKSALESFLKDNPNIIGSSAMMPNLPLPAKAFVDDFVTSQLNALPVGKAKSNAITRGDLSSNQLEALQKIVRKNLKEGKTTIGYEDYGTDFKYGDVGPSASSGNILKQLVFSPEYNLKTTLGRANIVTTPTDTLVVDQYNFNKGRGSSIFNPYAWYRTAKNIGTNPTLYTVPRKIAAQFGSQEGEGAPAIINTSEYSNGGIADSEKASKFRMMRPIQGQYFPGQAEGSVSTHISSVFESDGKYFVAPTITNKKAPYAGYQPQSFGEAYRAGEAIPFDSFDEAMFFSQNYKLPKYPRPEFKNGGETDPPTNPPNPYDITQTDLTSFESVNQNQLRYMNSPVYLDRLRAEGVTNPEEIRDSRINNINNTIIQTNPNDITGATPVPFNNKGQYSVNFGKDLQDVKELYPGTTARSVYSHELSHIAGGNNNPDAIAPLSEGATRQLQSTNINWQNAPWQDAEGYKDAGYGYDPFYNITDQRELNSWKNKYPDMGLPPGTDYWDENTNSFVKLSPGGTSKIYGRPEMKSGRFNKETGSYDEDTYDVPEGYPKKEAQKYLDYLTEVEQLPKDQKAYVNNLRYKGGDPNNKETKWWKKTIGKGREGNIDNMRWFTKADGTNVMDDVEWKTIKDRASNLFLRGKEYESRPMSREKWADNLPLEGAKTGRYKVLTDSHYGSAAEAKADLDGIRDFRETNYNFKREEETTPENWKQFIKDYKKSGVKDITIERTLEQYSEEDIIKNLNTIAMEQQSDFSTIAKYGGNMKKFKYKNGGKGSKTYLDSQRKRVTGSPIIPGMNFESDATMFGSPLLDPSYMQMMLDDQPGNEAPFDYRSIMNEDLYLDNMKNGGKGLWANIHAKRKRIAAGSGERMRTPGSEGAPTNEALKRSQARYGGKAMESPAFRADYEAEDGEVIVGNVSLDRMYNGGMLKSYGTGGMYSLSGPTHAEGGIGIINNDSNPSYVFSNNPKLKVPKQFAKGGTYADAAKGMSKSLENIAEMRMGGEGYDRATANLMEPLAMKEFSNLYDAQEQFKIDNNIGGNPINTAFNGGGFDPNKYQNSSFSLPTGLGLNPNSGGLQAPGSLQMPGNLGAGAESAGQSNKQGLPAWMIGANLLGPATNILGGLFGEAPTMDLGREQEENYRDFSSMARRYSTQQDKSLAGLRLGLEGSGVTGTQLRSNLQAGNMGAQQQAGQFYSTLAEQQAESNRQTDTTNREIRKGNLQKQMMESEFAAQNDPMNKFTAGIGQLGQVGAQLGMDQMRLNNLGTANFGAFGDFLKGIIG